jgi:phosphatidylserine decarboxylase
MNNFINPQGIRPIIFSFLVTLFFYIFISSFLGNLGFIITLLLIYIYRDTSANIVFKNKENILSPIDGKVFAIDNSNGKQKIYIKVNLCNGHNIKAPQDGEVKIKNYKCGLNLNPNSYKGSLLNEQVTMKFDNLKVKFISGICNSKIYFTQDSNVSQGDTVGLFLEGNAIITPKKQTSLEVKIGDKVIAGQSILFKI